MTFYIDKIKSVYAIVTDSVYRAREIVVRPLPLSERSKDYVNFAPGFLCLKNTPD